MDGTMVWALILIGAGATLAGAVGLALPPGERIAAGLALVIGAGIGVAVLAIGLLGRTSVADNERALLVASAVGFAAVAVSLVVLWRRSRS